MARTPRIRIRQVDEKEFKRLARNTKAKIRRTKKNYGIDLTDEVNIPSLDSFETRKEFNDWKKEMRSFTNRRNRRFQFRENQHGVVASKQEIDEIIALQESAQVNAKKARAELKKNLTERERPRILKKPDLQGFSVPKDFEFEEVKHQWRLEEIKRGFEDRTRAGYYEDKLETFKDNFIRSVEGTLGAYDIDGENVIDYLRSLDAIELYDLFQQDENNSVFTFEIWDSQGQMIPSEEEVMGKLSTMGNVLKKHEEGDINMDMKDF